MKAPEEIYIIPGFTVWEFEKKTEKHIKYMREDILEYQTNELCSIVEKLEHQNKELDKQIKLGWEAKNQKLLKELENNRNNVEFNRKKVAEITIINNKIIHQNKDLMEKNKDALDMLENIAYWDTCPQDYKDRIKLLTKTK